MLADYVVEPIIDDDDDNVDDDDDADNVKQGVHESSWKEQMGS